MGKRGNGAVLITKRKNGRYMARYTVRMPAGPKRRTIYVKRREEVRDKLAKALTDRADGIVYDDENMTADEYLDARSGTPFAGRCGSPPSTGTPTSSAPTSS